VASTTPLWPRTAGQLANSLGDPADWLPTEAYGYTLDGSGDQVCAFGGGPTFPNSGAVLQAGPFADIPNKLGIRYDGTTGQRIQTATTTWMEQQTGKTIVCIIVLRGAPEWGALVDGFGKWGGGRGYILLLAPYGGKLYINASGGLATGVTLNFSPSSLIGNPPRVLLLQIDDTAKTGTFYTPYGASSPLAYSGDMSGSGVGMLIGGRAGVSGSIKGDVGYFAAAILPGPLADPEAARAHFQARLAAVPSDTWPLPPLVARDYSGVAVTGQSLANGWDGDPPLSVAQPYSNLMFNGSVAPGSAPANLASLVPLIENSVPAGSAVETHCSAFANLVTALAIAAGKTHAAVMFDHAVAGDPYSALRCGTVPYNNGVAQMNALKTLAVAASKTYLTRAVLVVHGEEDHATLNPSYATDVCRWQSDYEIDIQRLLGQTERVPLIQMQFSSWTCYGASGPTSLIPYAQIAATLTRPNSIMLAAPGYPIPYSPIDGVHRQNVGYQRQGEYMAKAYWYAISTGLPWIPIRVLKVERTGAVVTVTWNLPPWTTTLSFDTVNVTDPNGQYGFEFDDGGTPIAIDASVIVGTNQTRHTLHSVPSGVNMRFRYAYTGTPGAHAGPTTGPRGCLKAATSVVSLLGYSLDDWACHTDEACP